MRQYESANAQACASFMGCLFFRSRVHLSTPHLTGHMKDHDRATSRATLEATYRATQRLNVRARTALNSCPSSPLAPSGATLPAVFRFAILHRIHLRILCNHAYCIQGRSQTVARPRAARDGLGARPAHLSQAERRDAGLAAKYGRDLQRARATVNCGHIASRRKPWRDVGGIVKRFDTRSS